TSICAVSTSSTRDETITTSTASRSRLAPSRRGERTRAWYWPRHEKQSAVGEAVSRRAARGAPQADRGGAEDRAQEPAARIRRGDGLRNDRVQRLGGDSSPGRDLQPAAAALRRARRAEEFQCALPDVDGRSRQLRAVRKGLRRGGKEARHG